MTRIFLLLLLLAQSAFASYIDVPSSSSSSGGTWGSITGTLSSQTDLNTALGLKATSASPTFTGTVTLPLGSITSSAWIGINIGTSLNGGDGKTITIGNSTIRTGDGQANQLGIYIPSGGVFYAYENAQQIFTLSATSANWGPFALSRDWTMQWQMGKGVSHYGKGVALGYGNDVAVGNVTTGEDDGTPETVQANALSSDGDRLEVKMSGTVGTGSTKTIKIYEDAALVHTITTTQDSVPWEVLCNYSRTAAATGNYKCSSSVGANQTLVTSGTLADTHTTTMVWKPTLESADGTTNDVIHDFTDIKHMKFGN